MNFIKGLGLRKLDCELQLISTISTTHFLLISTVIFYNTLIVIWKVAFGEFHEGFRSETIGF